MHWIFNKCILLALCAVLFGSHEGGAYAIVPVIASVTVAALCEYWQEDRGRRMALGALLIAAVWYVPLLYYVPLAFYDAWAVRPRWMMAVAALPLLAHFAYPAPLPYALIVLYAVLAILLRQQVNLLETRRRDNMALRDSAAELSTKLMAQNKVLLKGQDDQVRLARLAERNRIAREMHDTVGHVLSSAILQTSALLAAGLDEERRPQLQALHATLAGGMNEVRSAIHDLHDESVDLMAELQALVQGFAGARVSLDYDASEDMDRQIKYAFIAIVKEALSNAARHSNATKINIAVHEHPALYQLVIADNGTRKAEAHKEGMGLQNIRARVQQLGGIVTIREERGFELFISIRKEGFEKIVIVDDDRLAVLSLKTIVEAQDIEVVGAGYSGSEAVALYDALKPDILLMDIRMDGLSGLDAAEDILSRHPHARILLLTTFADDEYIVKALRLGIKGYILKEAFESIVPALRAVASGQAVFGEGIVSKLPNLMRPADRQPPEDLDLTPKEQEIAALVARGMNNREIAAALYLSEGRVRNAISTVLEKLNLRDRTQLAIFYHRTQGG